jgi:hypothetical protein
MEEITSEEFDAERRDMPYDSSLDEQLFQKAFDTEGGRLLVCVYSYNNGAKKLQFTREFRDKDGNFSFAKLGRLSKEEAQGVLPLIQEALTVM